MNILIKEKRWKMWFLKDEGIVKNVTDSYLFMPFPDLYYNEKISQE